MADRAVTDSQREQSRRRTDQTVEVVVRHVDAEQSGRPADEVYRVLNARLHAADVPLDSEQVREYAESISHGTWTPPRS